MELVADILDPAVRHATFLGDPFRIRQALLNVVENGIRHTPEGGEVVIRVSVVDDGVSADVLAAAAVATAAAAAAAAVATPEETVEGTAAKSATATAAAAALPNGDSWAIGRAPASGKSSAPPQARAGRGDRRKSNDWTGPLAVAAAYAARRIGSRRFMSVDDAPPPPGLLALVRESGRTTSSSNRSNSDPDGPPAALPSAPPQPPVQEAYDIPAPPPQRTLPSKTRTWTVSETALPAPQPAGAAAVDSTAGALLLRRGFSLDLRHGATGALALAATAAATVKRAASLTVEKPLAFVSAMVDPLVSSAATGTGAVADSNLAGRRSSAESLSTVTAANTRASICCGASSTAEPRLQRRQRTVRLRFEVVDTGCGFSQAKLESVFTPFQSVRFPFQFLHPPPPPRAPLRLGLRIVRLLPRASSPRMSP